MDLKNLGTLLAEASAPTPSGRTPNQPADMMQMVGMVLLMGIMFYFAFMRPQQKKAKQHAELLKSVKAGDKIITSSGIIGAVITVKEKTVSIRSADTKLEITKAAVAEIIERAGESSES
jgi:preprotein translocase subunit YajC